VDSALRGLLESPDGNTLDVVRGCPRISDAVWRERPEARLDILPAFGEYEGSTLLRHRTARWKEICYIQRHDVLPYARERHRAYYTPQFLVREAGYRPGDCTYCRLPQLCGDSREASLRPDHPAARGTREVGSLSDQPRNCKNSNIYSRPHYLRPLLCLKLPLSSKKHLREAELTTSAMRNLSKCQCMSINTGAGTLAFYFKRPLCSGHSLLRSNGVSMIRNNLSIGECRLDITNRDDSVFLMHVAMMTCIRSMWLATNNMPAAQFICHYKFISEQRYQIKKVRPTRLLQRVWTRTIYGSITLAISTHTITITSTWRKRPRR
jgi:hypothetical protein